MGASPFRRIVAVIAAIALILSGAAAAAAAVAGEPCGQAAMVAMASHDGMPCDHDGDGPDHPMRADAGLACFAKCPAPVLGQGTLALVRLPLPLAPPAARDVRLAGIGVAPPLHPPRT